jgi:surface antigen
MAQFKPRTTRPEAGNKYYITKAKGGYSGAIQGKPTDPDCDVLSNCVGYAYGRFNEIGGYGCCKYLYPTNAENFIQYAGDLEVGQTPKLGACMVWRKGASLSGSDGAGHVAIVEKIVSATEIVTSESGWNSKPFWTKTRKKGDGNWGAGTGYTFLGFIYNPAPCCGGSDTTANSGGTSSKPSNTGSTSKPASTGTTTAKVVKLTVDGKWGKTTTKRLQQIFGTPVDGEVSNQWAAYRASNPGLLSGWDWKEKPNGAGSSLIKAMQKWAGMPAKSQDGEWGPATCKAIQKKLGTPVDGKVSNPSTMVKALQTWANKQK